jgi:hypothetical protein
METLRTPSETYDYYGQDPNDTTNLEEKTENGHYEEPFGLDVGVEKRMDLSPKAYTSGTQHYYTEKSDRPPVDDFGDTTEDE